MVWQVVVQVGEGNFVLCPDGLSDDDFVDVIELIPVFIPAGKIYQLRQNIYTNIYTHNLISCIQGQADQFKNSRKKSHFYTQKQRKKKYPENVFSMMAKWYSRQVAYII